ncbi:hypothetical protein CBER1_11060 [Cercospora berteroae]|uniref:Tat pathway signal sequence n=1 Tax=Cercospora berteroae TaxID=357750 RepID=A0A2S6BYK0_9PEZI|nr:hypothetical protein CBER1_11060 [Cercospora berteroae]
MFTRQPQSDQCDSANLEKKKLLAYCHQNEEDREAKCNGRMASPSSPVPKPRRVFTMQWLAFSVVFVISTTLGGMLGYGLNNECTEKQCVRMTSSYSPLLEAVEYYDYQFQAELGAENVFKGHPRPELDEAWERVGRIHLLPLEEKYREELNKTHSGILYPPEQGGGVMVEIEVFHQLHCINYLRQVIYADYYSRPENLPMSFQVSDKMFFNHIGKL